MGKIKDAFKNLLFGFVLFIGSFVLLWWNEGNSARNIATADYMQKNATQIEPTNIQTSNDGLLIATKGSAVTNSTVGDLYIKLPNTLVLKRKVEMYQWEEETKKDSNGNETHEYTKTWSEMKINSDNFYDKTKHNPKFPIESDKFFAPSAKLGSFNLSSEQIKKIVPEKELYNLPPNPKYSIQDGKYFSGTNISNPNIGDILISYSYAPSGTDISFIGKQQSNSVTSFNYKGRNNYVQYNGLLDKEAIIEKYKQENLILTMTLRFLGWLLMFIGLKLLISPVIAIFGIIPFLGRIADDISSTILMLVSLLLSLITVAIAWVAYRPLLSLGLIVISLAIAYLVKQKLPKEKKNQE